ncbi:sulfite exporter TauE/SafE family protein [Marivibrio halodurans]|uniref:Probable membrane transporter protein n=1 Tax=Marivibrio halodurans TaxID=2039722 RepID=A0A8J7S225_9PROT|nr:sulfite exporter TauE/SafE family protein [Marivibrio halodurans]MBP5858845.1 sulfite exporter TauE/SafE family protein [Marivibrio halodurans]
MNFVPITDPLFYLVAIPGVLVAGISKGGFGGGLGIVAVPAMALVIGPVQAAAIMLPILCVMDLFGLAAYRRKADWRNLMCLLPGALVGTAIGALTFHWFDADAVRLTIGLVAVIFTLHHWSGTGTRRRPPGPDEGDTMPGPSHVRGGIWGTFAGFTSFVAHAGGPPVQFYMLPQRVDKTLYVGTTVWLFFIVNAVKLVPYSTLGLFSVQNLGTSLALLPLAPIGIWIGVRLHGLVGQALFYRIAYGLLFLTGLKLCWDGIDGLLRVT